MPLFSRPKSLQASSVSGTWHSRNPPCVLTVDESGASAAALSSAVVLGVQLMIIAVMKFGSIQTRLNWQNLLHQPSENTADEVNLEKHKSHESKYISSSGICSSGNLNYFCLSRTTLETSSYTLTLLNLQASRGNRLYSLCPSSLVVLFPFSRPTHWKLLLMKLKCPSKANFWIPACFDAFVDLLHWTRHSCESFWKTLKSLQPVCSIPLWSVKTWAKAWKENMNEATFLEKSEILQI